MAASMKRKRVAQATEKEFTNFHEMGLDDRILKAIAHLGWSKPTLIQERAIPLALEGKDLLARARTGSGKTAAYAIPTIQRILNSKQTAREQTVKALILVPSKELSKQAHQNIRDLTASCSREVKCAEVSGQVDLSAQRPLLMEKPDIVIGTPSRLLAHLQAKNLTLKDSLEMLIIDEADLLFSFGYEEDVKTLLGYLPKIYQAFLMSATLTDEVKDLKKLVLHNPITLKLEESQLPETDQLAQYHIKCPTDEKYLLIYTLLKLGLVQGNTLIFVNSIDRCYRLKLFLEQFSIWSCVLNSELPVNSRCHIVEQFNSGLYSIIIASDEGASISISSQSQGGKGKKSKQKKKGGKEYGVSRGIDFQNVANVINFDFPLSVDSYIHRVGRTARADNQGTALSFVSEKEMDNLRDIEEFLVNEDGTSYLKAYTFKMSEIEGFRYRAMDAMRAVTRVAVREARIKELKTEILSSQKLKSYFEDNPRDLQLLRHDKVLHPAKIHAELKHVPEYLVPKTLRTGTILTSSKTKRKNNHKRGGRDKSNKERGIKESQAAKKKRKNAEDPLKSFKYKRPEST